MNIVGIYYEPSCSHRHKVTLTYIFLSTTRPKRGTGNSTTRDFIGCYIIESEFTVLYMKR